VARFLVLPSRKPSDNPGNPSSNAPSSEHIAHSTSDPSGEPSLFPSSFYSSSFYLNPPNIASGFTLGANVHLCVEAGMVGNVSNS
jgi:hypothetical protein